MKTRLLRPFLLCATLLALAVSLPAQIIFTITGTADATAQGYTSGLSYTFIYTTGASYPTAASFGNTTFNGGSNAWADTDETDPALFTSITGTGVTGTYTHDADTVSVLTASSFTQFTALNNSLNNGLKTPANGTINNVYTYLDGGLATPTYSGSYVSPVTYFSTREGSYSAPAGSVVRVYYTAGDWVNFTVTNVQVSAVPEPATYAALAGMAGLALVVWPRLCRHRKNGLVNITY